MENAGLVQALEKSENSTPVSETGPQRSTSLIPAYNINKGSIEDLQLESLLGTPYTCEIKEATKTKKTSVLKRSKSSELRNVHANSILQAEVDDTQPPAAGSPSSSVEQEVDCQAKELIGALDALSITESLHGPLRGLPKPLGVHLRFDDDGNSVASPHLRVFLRGLPEPTGRHSRFD